MNDFFRKHSIIIEHTLPWNVPSIRTTSIHNKGYALHTEIKLQQMGNDPNPTLRKFPYDELAEKGGALKYKTRTWYTAVVLGTHIRSIRYQVRSTRYQVRSTRYSEYILALVLLESWAEQVSELH